MSGLVAAATVPTKIRMSRIEHDGESDRHRHNTKKHDHDQQYLIHHRERNTSISTSLHPSDASSHFKGSAHDASGNTTAITVTTANTTATSAQSASSQILREDVRSIVASAMASLETLKATREQIMRRGEETVGRSPQSSGRKYVETGDRKKGVDNEEKGRQTPQQLEDIIPSPSKQRFSSSSVYPNKGGGGSSNNKTTRKRRKEEQQEEERKNEKPAVSSKFYRETETETEQSMTADDTDKTTDEGEDVPSTSSAVTRRDFSGKNLREPYHHHRHRQSPSDNKKPSHHNDNRQRQRQRPNVSFTETDEYVYQQDTFNNNEGEGDEMGRGADDTDDEQYYRPRTYEYDANEESEDYVTSRGKRGERRDIRREGTREKRAVGEEMRRETKQASSENTGIGGDAKLSSRRLMASRSAEAARVLKSDQNEAKSRANTEARGTERMSPSANQHRRRVISVVEYTSEFGKRNGLQPHELLGLGTTNKEFAEVTASVKKSRQKAPPLFSQATRKRNADRLGTNRSRDEGERDNDEGSDDQDDSNDDDNGGHHDYGRRYRDQYHDHDHDDDEELERDAPSTVEGQSSDDDEQKNSHYYYHHHYEAERQRKTQQKGGNSRKTKNGSDKREAFKPQAAMEREAGQLRLKLAATEDELKAASDQVTTLSQEVKNLKQSLSMASITAKQKDLDHDAAVAGLRVAHQTELTHAISDLTNAKHKGIADATDALRKECDAEIDRLKSELNATKTQYSDVTRRFQQFRKDHGQQKEKIALLEEASERLTKDLELRNKKIEELNRAVKDSKHFRKLAEDQLVAKGHELELEVSKHSAYEAKVADLTNQLKACEDGNKAFEEQASEELKRLSKLFEESRAVHEGRLAEANVKLERHEKLKVKAKEMRQQATETDSLMRALKEQLSKAEQEILRLQQLYEDSQAQRQEEREALEEALNTEREGYQSFLKQTDETLAAVHKDYSEKFELLKTQCEKLDYALQHCQKELEDEREAHENTERVAGDLELQLESAAERQRLAEVLAKEKFEVYKQHTNETISSLKKQIGDKDKRSEHLAVLSAGSTETIQRLRDQLADERSKNAALEAQMREVKGLAKRVGDNLQREVRRSEIRNLANYHSNAPTSPSSVSSSHVPSTLEGMMIGATPTSGNKNQLALETPARSSSIASSNNIINNNGALVVSPEPRGVDASQSQSSAHHASHSHSYRNSMGNAMRVVTSSSSSQATLVVSAAPTPTPMLTTHAAMHDRHNTAGLGLVAATAAALLMKQIPSPARQLMNGRMADGTHTKSQSSDDDMDVMMDAAHRQRATAAPSPLNEEEAAVHGHALAGLIPTPRASTLPPHHHSVGNNNTSNNPPPPPPAEDSRVLPLTVSSSSHEAKMSRFREQTGQLYAKMTLTTATANGKRDKSDFTHYNEQTVQNFEQQQGGGREGESPSDADEAFRQLCINSVRNINYAAAVNSVGSPNSPRAPQGKSNSHQSLMQRHATRKTAYSSSSSTSESTTTSKSRTSSPESSGNEKRKNVLGSEDYSDSETA